MPRTFDLDDDSVVLIIGSGAGGGTLGNELAQKGVRTLILEAGPRIEREEHIDDERQSFAQLAWLDKRATSGSWWIAKDSPNLPAWVCKVVGGTTVHWGGGCLRFQEHEFRAKDVYGDIPGASLLNWPLTLAELEPYYDKAEDKMGVTGTHGIPLLDADNNQIVMAAGAKKIGYKEYSTGNMAINSRPRDGRPATIHDGFCFQGIRSNAKWSTLNTEIPKGEATGNLEVRPESHVLKIENDQSGKAIGVVYADKAGNHHRQRARIVCLAGNSIETPRILLNSASSQYPNGLANSSGQVGRNYMRHMSGWGLGRVRTARSNVPRAHDGRLHKGRAIPSAGSRIRRWLFHGNDSPRSVGLRYQPCYQRRYQRFGPRLHAYTGSECIGGTQGDCMR